MHSSAIAGRTRPGFNFTELSTASLLIGVSATCAMPVSYTHLTLPTIVGV